MSSYCLKYHCVLHASVSVMITENTENILDLFFFNLSKERAPVVKHHILSKACVIYFGNFSVKPGLALNEIALLEFLLIALVM